MRRWASTVKPPMDTRAIRSMPTVANASTMVDGIDAVVLVVDPAVVDVGGQVLGRCRGRVEEDAHRGRVRHLTGRDQRELVQQALGILDDADDRLPALRPRVCRRERFSSEASPGVIAT